MPQANIPDWLQHVVELFGGGIGGTLLTGLLGRRKMVAEARAAESDAHAKDVKASADLEQVVSERLTTLLEAYEKRIADLTSEVTSLRNEVKSLRKALDERPKPQPQIGI